MREGVQDIGEQELLVLLLVMEPDLENPQDLRKLAILGPGKQPLDRRIDVGAEGRDVLAVRPREQPPSRPRMTRASRHIIGVEKIGEALIEDAIAGQMRHQQELLEKPGRMRAMPFGRARIGHRLHHLILRAERRRAALGFRAHGAEGIAPGDARIVRWGGCEIGLESSSRRRRRTGDKVAGVMPNPGLEKSKGDRKLLWGIDCSSYIGEKHQI